MTKTPTPAYVDTKRNNSREYRAVRADYSNMLLNEARPDNRLDESKWTGNAFAGHWNFVPYVGKGPIRPGVKLERDIQTYTLPKENAKLLNNSSMGRAQVHMSGKQTD